MDSGVLYCSTEGQLLIGRASFVEFVAESARLNAL